jgi:hypothetical protein
MFTTEEMQYMETTTVSLENLAKVGLNDSYYISPLLYIRDVLHLQLTCTIQEYRFAVECANDEDVAPHDASLPVIVDGVLAYIYADYLKAVGLDLVSYITYRFTPPSPEFQAKLDKFEQLINDNKVEVSQ